LIEIRKFACGLEEVLFVQYEDNKFPGNYITEAERIKNNLPAATRSHDEL
jgi:hypothetical protein